MLDDCLTLKTLSSNIRLQENIPDLSFASSTSRCLSGQMTEENTRTESIGRKPDTVNPQSKDGQPSQ
eukprot:9487885-Pyramimonas_sp.AAC.1